MIRRFLVMVIGLALLLAGVAVLWTARGPQLKEERTTGGVLTTQAEIAQQGAAQQGITPDLGVTTDEGFTSTNIVGAAEMSGQALSDVSSGAGGKLRPEITTNTAGLTTDVVLNNDTEVAVAPLSIEESAPAGDGQGGVSTGSVVYEQRVVEMEWPVEFQVGRTGLVRVKLKVLSSGALQPVAEIDENEVVATPILITDRYDTYDGSIIAKLSAPDFSVEATSTEQQTITRGSEPEWRWTLKPDGSGSSIITLNLTIVWQPKPGTSGTLIQTPIWGQTLQVKTNYVFGQFTVPQASVLGTVLAVMGFIGQFPLLEKFLEIFLDVLFDRDRRDRRRDDRRRRSRR